MHTARTFDVRITSSGQCRLFSSKRTRDFDALHRATSFTLQVKICSAGRNLRSVDDDTGESDEGGECVGGQVAELEEVHPTPQGDLHRGNGGARLSIRCAGIQQRTGKPGQRAFELSISNRNNETKSVIQQLTNGTISPGCSCTFCPSSSFHTPKSRRSTSRL